MTKPLRRGFVVNSVLLSILLLVLTASVVGALVTHALYQEIERATDQRLISRAESFHDYLANTQETLSIIGIWVARDEEFRQALQADQLNPLASVEQRLAPILALAEVDEALVADRDGEVLARLRVDEPPGRGGNIGQDSGFVRARVGRVAAGIGRENTGLLQQEVYLPIGAERNGSVIGVLRLASFLDRQDLERFRARSAVEVSLFYDQDRLVTTLPREGSADALPSDLTAEQAIYRQVSQSGQGLLAWRELAGIRVRSYSAPLDAPDGTRIGMFSVAVPASALAGELNGLLLPILPPILLVIFLGAGLIYLLTSRVRAPVLSLAEAAKRLQDGDLATPIPRVKEAELEPLAGELERARVSIHQNLDSLAREEARQRALFAALHEPILTTSPDGRVLEFNPAAAALFGGPQGLTGRFIQELLPFVPAPTANAPDGSGEATWRGALRDHHDRPLEVEVSRTVLIEGRLPLTHVYVVHDVSHHVDLERRREQLLYNVAHELRGPVSVLDNVLEVISAEYDSLSVDEFRQLTGSAQRTVKRLRTLTEDLLSAGTIQAGRFVVRPQPTDLSEIIDEALGLVGAAIESRGQRVARQVPSEKCVVLADPPHLRQVFTNLLTNASKFSPVGDTITVRADKYDGQVRITIEDHGPGIPAAEQAGLFERFYRAQTSRDRSGFGLGLAVSKGIVEAHRGTIGVESKPGDGTQVWFTVPTAGESA